MTTYVLVAACVISLAVLLYLRQVDKPDEQKTAASEKAARSDQTQANRAKNERTAPPGVAKNKTIKNAAPKPVTATSEKKFPPRVITPPPVGQAPAVQTTTGSRDTRQITRKRTPLPKKSKKAATKIVPPTSPKTTRKASPKTAATTSAADSRSGQAPQYSRLQKADMVLQAIAWAPEPTKRIAVINGSIVKEGETIEGFTLMRIRKDDIVLNDGRKTWQLDFGFKP